MKKRVIFIILAVTLIATMISACGRTAGNSSTDSSKTDSQASKVESSKETVDANLLFAYWEPTQKKFVTQLNDIFIKENPGVTIEQDVIPGDQYDQVLKTRLLSGEGPDVYFYFGSSLYKQGKNGFYGEITNESYADNILPAFKDIAMYQGKLFAVPLDAAANGVFYNKAVFDKLNITTTPKTYDEFLSLCEKIKTAGIAPITMGGKDLWVQLHWLGCLYGSFVAGKYENIQADRYDGKYTFATSPEFKNMFTKYIGLLDKGYIIEGAVSLTHTQAIQALADGTAAMDLMGNWIYNEVKAANPDCELGYFALPDENGKITMVGAANTGIGYNANSKQADLAKKLVGVYARPESNKIMCDLMQTLPCIKGVDVNLADCLKAQAADLAKVSNIFTFMDVQWPSATNDSWRKDSQTILIGERNIDKILKNLDKVYEENKSTIEKPSVK